MNSDVESDREDLFQILTALYNRKRGRGFRIVTGSGKNMLTRSSFSHFAAPWPRWFANRQNGNVTGAGRSTSGTRNRSNKNIP